MRVFGIQRRQGNGRAMLASDIGCVMRPVSEYGFYLTIPRDLQRADTGAHPDLLEALEKAAKQFEFYGREHRNKAAALPGTSTTDPAYLTAHAKARTNEEFAAMCRAAIEKATKP